MPSDVVNVRECQCRSMLFSVTVAAGSCRLRPTKIQYLKNESSTTGTIATNTWLVSSCNATNKAAQLRNTDSITAHRNAENYSTALVRVMLVRVILYTQVQGQGMERGRHLDLCAVVAQQNSDERRPALF